MSIRLSNGTESIYSPSCPKAPRIVASELSNIGEDSSYGI
jgi:hypothetical protein